MVVDSSCGALKNKLQSTFDLPDSSHFGFLDGKSFNPGLMRINEANFSTCQSVWRALVQIHFQSLVSRFIYLNLLSGGCLGPMKSLKRFG